MTKREDDQVQRILEAERLDDDGLEMREIRRVREEVESILRAAFGYAGVSIKYGGSKAKGTMLKGSYDLDILIYFHRNNVRAGTSLKGIYHAVAKVLAQHYRIDLRTTAIRLFAKDDVSLRRGLHVDVIPGRYIDDTQTRVFLHQENDDEKDRLMTDPVEHVRFVKDSGVLDAVCVLKLLRIKNGLLIKQFPLEILSVDLLQRNRQRGLADQVRCVLTDLVGMTAPPRIEDPANLNRDLSHLLDTNIWADLRAAARQAANMGWNWPDILMSEPVAAAPAVFTAVKSVSTPTQPWAD